jgi:hypothetical protein
VGWESTHPTSRFARDDYRANGIRKERGKMLSVGFFSGLVSQSEIDDLLDMLYGSYGERLMVSYKKAS